MKRNTAVGSRGAEPPVTPVPVSRWSRTATGFTGVSVLAVVVMAVIPFVLGGPAEQPLITLLTFVAMASLWNLLAGFSGLTSFGQQAYIGVGAYALYLVAEHGVNPFGGIAVAAIIAAVVALPVSALVLRLSGGSGVATCQGFAQRRASDRQKAAQHEAGERSQHGGGDRSHRDGRHA